MRSLTLGADAKAFRAATVQGVDFNEPSTLQNKYQQKTFQTTS